MRPTVWVAALMMMLLPAVASAEEAGSFLGVPRPLWLTINLAGFLFVLIWFVGRPLGRFLQDRRDGIRGDLESAREKLAAAEKLRQEVVDRLAQVEREVGALREQAKESGRKDAQRIRNLAEEEAARFVEKVGAEIGRREAETRQRLAADTAALAAQLAHELLERETTEADRKRILQRSLKALSQTRDGRS